MLGQEKKIKGLTIIELIIVLSIVGIMSAVAYPNFTEWNNERRVRGDVDKVYALIKNVHMQTERGTFAYVQVKFSYSDEDELIVQSRGLSMAEFTELINVGENPDEPDIRKDRCDLESDTYWTTDTSSSEKIQNAVYSITLEHITSNIADQAGICFSRNGRFYEAKGDLAFEESSGVPYDHIYLCSNERSISCNIEFEEEKHSNDNKPNPMVSDNEKPLYLNVIKWSRYGNFSKMKWQKDDWES